ncbi:hypothetical protein C8R46DRAFT_1356485 [Mycena filopes]|nr:hypothetical protein C8R46DRAFT_1356485 [Mycena filopes]
MVYCSFRFLVLATLAIGFGNLASAAPAEVTLALPLFQVATTEPATILGVDAQGRTTYALNQDATVDSSVFKVTGTLVAAADYAAYTLSADVPKFVHAELGCGIKNGVAVCTGLGDPTPFTVTSLQPFVVDVLATATPTQTERPNSSGRLIVPMFGALMGFLLAYHLS